MKKFLLFALSLVLCFCLCACGNDREDLAKEYVEAVIENDWNTVKEQFYFWGLLKGVKDTNLANANFDSYTVSVESEEEKQSLVEAYDSVVTVFDKDATLETVYVIKMKLKYTAGGIEKTEKFTVTVGVIDGNDYIIDYGFKNIKF